MGTLANLKKDMKLGSKWRLIERFGQPEDKERIVGHVQGNSIAFHKDDKPKGSWLAWPKASLLDYDGKTVKIYGPGKRPLTQEEQDVCDSWESQRDTKLELLDIQTDGSSQWYRKMRYFEDRGMKYMLGTFSGPLRYSHKDHTIIDESIKGDVQLVYERIE
jgi:hypothetical protein